MDDTAISEIAQSFGMDLEGAVGLPGDEKSFRLYKGAKQVFTGTEQDLRNFFARYEKNRPALFVESMYAYKE